MSSGIGVVNPSSAGSAPAEGDPTRPIPVNIPKFWGSEVDSVCATITEGWISSEGPAVRDFEQAIAAKCQRRFAVACANGTAALDIAFHALDIRPGDEVVLPDLTIISCVNEVVKRGGVPVFIDCVGEGAQRWNLNLVKVAAKITKRTRAVVAVHLYEFPVDMEQLQAIVAASANPKCVIIEDAAEMMGQVGFSRLAMLHSRSCATWRSFGLVRSLHLCTFLYHEGGFS